VVAGVDLLDFDLEREGDGRETEFTTSLIGAKFAFSLLTETN
jgi:hypothetical protein